MNVDPLALLFWLESMERACDPPPQFMYERAWRSQELDPLLTEYLMAFPPPTSA